MEINEKKIDVNIYKLQLRNVIENLKLLENYRDGVGETKQQHEIEALMSKTTNLLNELEAAPSVKVCQKLEKRRRKRQKAKERRKLHKAEKRKPLTTSPAKLIKKPKIPIKVNVPLGRPNAVTQKPHQELLSFYDSTRFLRTFELLELLHLKRSQDMDLARNFSNQLSKLRTIWNVIRQENKPERTTSQDIKHQWSTVLFGAQEKLYYKKAENFNDLLSVRRKWDSFLAQNKKLGSSIPYGWVLPPENPNKQWQIYQCKLLDSDSTKTE